MTDPTYFADADAFSRWLQAHGASAAELLVGFHKVATGRPCMSWSESVDAALCFGWIDGRRNSVDDASYTIRFTPRKAGSIWSKVNIAKVAQLRAQGRMRPAGEAAFARRMEARSGVYAHEQEHTAALSGEECILFQRNQAAWAYFETTPPGYKKRVLHWITDAKRDATRRSRLASLIEACAAGQRLTN